MSVVIGRTHRPCGACAELVELGRGCEHLRVKRVRSKPPRATTAAERAAGLAGLPAMLAAIGYPRA
jgi:hypothetical protein